jgi:hypothetical protein
MKTSVYRKLNEAREIFHRSEMEKTGENKFAQYFYFQLADILPDALAAFGQVGLCGVITFGAEIATMRIVDTESGEGIEITSPMSTASLRGCHPVQNLGAVQTYLRRYLWASALELVEQDAVDSEPPTPPPPPATKTAPLPTRPVKPVPAKAQAKRRELLEGEEAVEVTIDHVDKERKTSKAGKSYTKWSVTTDVGDTYDTINRDVGPNLHEGPMRLVLRTEGRFTSIVDAQEIEAKVALEPEAPKELSWTDEVTKCEQLEGKEKWELRFFSENDSGWTKDTEVAIEATRFVENSSTVLVSGIRDKNGALWIKSIREVEEEEDADSN